MKLFLQIITETFFLLKSAIYTILGFFIKPSDHPEGENNPVILIPGLMGSQFVWSKLRRKLISEGFPVYVPHLNFQLGSFENNGRKLEEFILEKNLKNAYIIAHSSGGMIATQMGYRGRDRVKKLFAVSVPFHGSLLAIFIFFIPAGRQLIPWSTFIKNNDINFKTFSNLQSLYSRFDLTIIPGFQARLGRNDDVEFDGIGHLNIFMSKPGVEFLLNLLRLEESKEPAKKKPEVKPQSVKNAQIKTSIPVKKTAKQKTVQAKPAKIKKSASAEKNRKVSKTKPAAKQATKKKPVLRPKVKSSANTPKKKI
jgi:pimeloyl-ACP methyl ester carboxylesterase